MTRESRVKRRRERPVADEGGTERGEGEGKHEDGVRETRRQRHGDEGGEFGEEDDGASEETRGGGDAGKPSGGDGAADGAHRRQGALVSRHELFSGGDVGDGDVTDVVDAETDDDLHAHGFDDAETPALKRHEGDEVDDDGSDAKRRHRGDAR